MGDTGGRKQLLWQQRFATRAFIRVRVGTVEQRIVLRGFETTLNRTCDQKDRVHSKIT